MSHITERNEIPHFPTLYRYLHQDSSEDLKTKAKRALKSVVGNFYTMKCKLCLTIVIQKCTHLATLEPLLQESPPNILTGVS